MNARPELGLADVVGVLVSLEQREPLLGGRRGQPWAIAQLSERGALGRVGGEQRRPCLRVAPLPVAQWPRRRSHFRPRLCHHTIRS